MIEGRFQEYSDFYIPGFDRYDRSAPAVQARKNIQRKQELVPIETISKTPMFFMMGEKDSICPPEDVQYYIGWLQIRPVEYSYRNIGHEDFVLGANLTDLLVKDMAKIVKDLNKSEDDLEHQEEL